MFSLEVKVRYREIQERKENAPESIYVNRYVRYLPSFPLTKLPHKPGVPVQVGWNLGPSMMPGAARQLWSPNCYGQFEAIAMLNLGLTQSAIVSSFEAANVQKTRSQGSRPPSKHASYL